MKENKRSVRIAIIHYNKILAIRAILEAIINAAEAADLPDRGIFMFAGRSFMLKVFMWGGKGGIHLVVTKQGELTHYEALERAPDEVILEMEKELPAILKIAEDAIEGFTAPHPKAAGMAPDPSTT